jgi:hypothetical protein
MQLASKLVLTVVKSVGLVYILASAAGKFLTNDAAMQQTGLIQ